MCRKLVALDLQNHHSITLLFFYPAFAFGQGNDYPLQLKQWYQTLLSFTWPDKNNGNTKGGGFNLSGQVTDLKVVIQEVSTGDCSLRLMGCYLYTDLTLSDSKELGSGWLIAQDNCSFLEVYVHYLSYSANSLPVGNGPHLCRAWRYLVSICALHSNIIY